MARIKKARIDAYEGRLEDREIEVYNHDSKIKLEQQKRAQEFWQNEQNQQTDEMQIDTTQKTELLDQPDQEEKRIERNAAIRLIQENKKREVFRDKRQIELDQLKNKGEYTRTRIKIRFPDQFVIVASFGAKETVQDVYDFVKENLMTVDRPFHLFETPPKRILQASTQRLFQVKLVPSGSLYFSFNDAAAQEPGPFLNLGKLKQFVTAY